MVSLCCDIILVSKKSILYSALAAGREIYDLIVTDNSWVSEIS